MPENETEANPSDRHLLGANPREVVGGNNPPLWVLLRALMNEENFAQTVTDFLRDEYRQWPITGEELLTEARALPKEITDAETKAKAASLVKRLRDLKSKLEAMHAREKEAYYRGGQAVDQFFFGWIAKLFKRNRNDNAGAGDVLLARITTYDNRVLAEEQERRDAEAAEARRVLQAAQAKREQEEREAEETRQAAERARKPEIKEAKVEAAAQQENVASAARVEESVALQAAEAAHVQTLAKPAEIMRTRTDDGTLTTMAQEGYAELVDKDVLELEPLRPHLKPADLEKALRQYAKSTDYKKPLKGASIGRRNKSVVR